MTSCKKKKLDKIGSMLALATTKRSKKGNRLEKRSYYCKHCGSYHLTSEEKLKSS